jgi:hypothetical protein
MSSKVRQGRKNSKYTTQDGADASSVSLHKTLPNQYTQITDPPPQQDQRLFVMLAQVIKEKKKVWKQAPNVSTLDRLV